MRTHWGLEASLGSDVSQCSWGKNELGSELERKPSPCEWNHLVSICDFYSFFRLRAHFGTAQPQCGAALQKRAGVLLRYVSARSLQRCTFPKACHSSARSSRYFQLLSPSRCSTRAPWQQTDSESLVQHPETPTPAQVLKQRR